MKGPWKRRARRKNTLLLEVNEKGLISALDSQYYNGPNAKQSGSS